MNLSFTKNQNGFTLLEMIVSLGIFSVVAVIAVGSLVRITSLNRQAQAMQSTMNNVNYVLESISREMRPGSHFHCTEAATVDPGTGNNNMTMKECNINAPSKKGILFKSSKFDPANSNCPLIYAYWFDTDSNGNWQISKSKQVSCGESLKRDNAIPLIDDPSIVVTDVDFSVNQNGIIYNGYSWATIRLVGYAGTKEKEKNNFDIRTGVSQRIKDL